MMTALQLMLVSFADDKEGGALLFPAWPCAWDVDFKLRLPRNGTVSGVFSGGAVSSLVFDPPELKSIARVLDCQNVL